MEIQERLYSVQLTEKEIRLFSDYQKEFGFLDNLTGNKKLHQSIISGLGKPYTGWMKNDSKFGTLPADLLGYLRILEENDINSSITMNNSKNTRLVLMGLDKIEDQIDGKTVGGYQKSEEPRIVIMATCLQGNNEYVLSWYPNSKTYRITKESLKYMFLSRAINWIFGDHGIQVVQEFGTFKEAFNDLNKVGTITTYYSETEETEKQKKSRRKGIPGSSVAGGVVGGGIMARLRMEDLLTGKHDTWIGGNAKSQDLRKKIAKNQFEEIDRYNNVADTVMRKGSADNARSIRDYVKPKVEHNAISSDKAIRKINKLIRNRALRDVGIATAAGAGLGLAAGVIHSKEQKKKNLERNKRKYQKEFTKKEDYKNGEETEFQKKNRKNLTGNLVGLGATTGSVIGITKASTNMKNLKKASKISRRATEDSAKTLDILIKMKNKFFEKGGRFKDKETEEAFDRIFKHGQHRLDINAKGSTRALKVAKAMDKKNIVKKGLGGALIGTAVSAPLAYAAGKAMKNRNERINKARRNKTKEK